MMISLWKSRRTFYIRNKIELWPKILTWVAMIIKLFSLSGLTLFHFHSCKYFKGRYNVHCIVLLILQLLNLFPTPNNSYNCFTELLFFSPGNFLLFQLVKVYIFITFWKNRDFRLHYFLNFLHRKPIYIIF